MKGYIKEIIESFWVFGNHLSQSIYVHLILNTEINQEYETIEVKGFIDSEQHNVS